MKSKEKVLQADTAEEQEPAPFRVGESDMLIYLKKEPVTWESVNAIKALSNTSDKVLSEWLNINQKTLRSYRQSNSPVKGQFKEHLVYLLHLAKLGNAVFGSKEEFDTWLNTPNAFFDHEHPAEYIQTITGMQFLLDRLTAMEYGDNV